MSRPTTVDLEETELERQVHARVLGLVAGMAGATAIDGAPCEFTGEQARMFTAAWDALIAPDAIDDDLVTAALEVFRPGRRVVVERDAMAALIIPLRAAGYPPVVGEGSG